MKYKNGEEFLNNLYSNMHMEDVVMHHTEKSDTPTEKIGKYLNRLERVHDKAKDSKHKMDILKSFYYDKYVIKELPESYINLQRKIARERGYGDITVTDKMKEEWLLQIQNEQKISLNIWLDYLTSDDAMYPMWFKHYAFRGMLKLNKFNKEKKEFGKRSKSTVEPYVELNREALARVYNSLVKEIGSNEEISEDASKALENGESFKKLYEYYLMKTEHVTRDKNTDGIWKKYDQGVDYEGLNLFEKTQLSQGDLYIYYTKDLDGNYSNSRLTIYMNGNDKVVGVSSFLEDYLAEKSWLSVVAAKKVSEFSNRGKFLTCIYNTYLLNEIEKKINDNLQLTKEEIKLLYQIDCSTESFGSLEEPRIKRLKLKRDFKTDIAYFYDLSVNNVGTNLEDFDKNEIVCYLGDIVYDGKTVPDKFKHLQYVYGNLYLNNVEVCDNLGNLKEVDNLYMNNLKDASGLHNFKRAKEDCFLSSLPKAKGLENFEEANYVDLNSLEDASGLGLKYVNHNLGINSLTSSKGFENLEYVGRNIFCENLDDTIGFTNLQSVNGRPAEEFISYVNKRHNSVGHKLVKVFRRGKR